MSADTPVWAGHVNELGRLGWQVDETEERRAYLSTLAGQEVDIIVRPRTRKRTTPQNRYIHVVVTRLVPQLGYHEVGTNPAAMAELKRDLLGECFGWAETPMGHPAPIKPHTSDLTVGEMSAFIDWLFRFAAERGIYVLAPGERAAA